MNCAGCIESSKTWVEQVIVKYNFCPFAHHDVMNNRVRYQCCVLEDNAGTPVSADTSEAAVARLLTSLAAEFAYLEQHADTETTLLILPSGADDFYIYLNLLAIAEQYLRDEGYEGVFQIASFHPQYVFAGSASDDPANYTNRSPYPMLHILREASLERVLADFADPEMIPERNIEFARRKGALFFAVILAKLKA